jgi:monovalent cation/hydrogen antiporter
MEDFKIVVFIMAILITLTAIANKRKLPYPILLVGAGITIGFIPQLPQLALDPEVIFVILLPPLLYDAAYRTSWNEFRCSIRPISALAITLVFFTTTAVAITAYFLIPGFTWALAFVLGAVVAPPDASAAAAVIRGLGLNKKVVTIIHGESLVNDAAALIAYRYAVTAVTTGSFFFWQAGLQFLVVATVGIAIGVVTGWLFVQAHKKIENNPVVETSFTLLAPYISYLAAEHFHASGVLAVVSTGLVMSRKAPEVFSYETRMRVRTLWEIIIFLMHGFIFILIGLQLPSIIHNLGTYSFLEISGYGLIISGITILVRMIWVFAGAYLQNRFRKKKKPDPDVMEPDTPDDTWKNVLVVAWTGTRGVISLAAALALPFFMENGLLFPKRHSIIFLSFMVIFVTLVVQGLSLPLLVRWLKISKPESIAGEENELQLYLATHTLQYIEESGFPVQMNPQLQQQVKSKYELLVKKHTLELQRQARAKRLHKASHVVAEDIQLNVQLAISQFQRSMLLKLHQEGLFSDEVVRQTEREMDIDELKLNMQLSKTTSQQT